MLGALEQRLVELVADALEGRDDLTVEAPGPPTQPAPGDGAVRVGLVTLGPIAGFEPRSRPAPPGDDAAKLHRPLRLVIEAAIDIARRPSAADGGAARQVALDDMARIGHALDATTVRDGSALATAGDDPGFLVTELRLASGEVLAVADDGTVHARLVYRGLADVWPPEAPEDAGSIDAVTLLAAAQPLVLELAEPAVRLGGATRIIVRGVPARRPGPGGPVGVAIAVRVRGRLPAAGRGTVTSGTAGAEAGVRIVAVTDPATELEYRAPAAMPAGEPLERLEVFVARGDGRRGLLLGSLEIRLRDLP